MLEPLLKAKPKNVFEKLNLQIQLLLWKRYAEQTKSKWDLLKVIVPAVLFFVLLILMYSVFSIFADGGLEPFVIPLAFWIFTQRLVVQLMYEKSTKLQESMRMMGLSDLAYWLSYFISDGVILGGFLSFLCTLFTVGGLFNHGNFGAILGLLFCFCLSAVPFCFFICAFFDTPQTSGQATLGVLFAFYVLYIVVFTVNASDAVPIKTSQVICCLFPPMALQIGSGSFLKSYDGIPLSLICGLMIVDIFIYSALAWYFSQVWPSKVGVPKPWYFVVDYNYWFPAESSRLPDVINSQHELMDSELGENKIPVEVVNEKLLGSPTVEVSKLRKTFGSQVSVNDLSFKMYENQIFALLGHNGAGKTTTISMLTGLIQPDFGGGHNSTTIYGRGIHSEMDQIRYSLGVCPQHDVLFDNLTVREHILFFAQLKGASFEAANEDATKLTTLFHLEERLDHLGGELSGGQRRKLSVAIAVCGGSKFIVLDEPTAGMDPLARRELWDLLAGLRKGRTMLLTTHYMDEADILGDRVGIMSLGQMQCVGSTQFLKSTYGAGYKLVFDKAEGMDADQLGNLTSFVKAFIPEAQYFEEDGADTQAMYSLPFSTVSKFGEFFTRLDSNLKALSVSTYGINITSLEDVFLKVGEDHSVTPQVTSHGIGKNRVFESNFSSQVIGISRRKLTYALNDFTTIPLLLLPIAVSVTAAVLLNQQVISSQAEINDVVVAAMYMGGYLGVPGLISEFIVRERNDKLRNLLTVMGCDFRAYWLGTLIADYIIMSIPMVCMWITWFGAGMTDFYETKGGINFLITIIFNLQMIAFSYFFSFIFSSPKSAISLMPICIIMLLITPNITLLICILIARGAGASIGQDVQGGILLWGLMILSPHGALFTSFVDTTQDYSAFISVFPPVGATLAFMLTETALFLGYTYYVDAQTVAATEEQLVDPTFKPHVLDNLDDDVKAERDRTHNDETSLTAPLRIERLRKVFPPKRVGKRSVIATEDVSFVVNTGEIFGLLGANGAGKTTTLSMLTRHLVPTSGNAFIVNHSILSDFSKGATHLGVVTQNNSLWDRLSVEAHLFLFARLRGVPEDLVKQVVDGTIDQLELTPHRHKLAMRLSGGMKRKLCVAIALIGDPEVVLLDEPSAGLDPVSRRNLWSVILRTMSHRAVILTTHSMDEAEALCKRIGIMVHGQLRALGTKQHLKNKFGSGFELVVKLQVTNLEEQLSTLSDFVTSLFPSSTMISENGGLVTYEVPKEEMKMGVAFSELEENKMRLSIEDYSVAQPTLEQVFIRTVAKHSASAGLGRSSKEAALGTSFKVGGGTRLSVEGLGMGLGEEEAEGEELVPEEKNRCGCTNTNMHYIIAGLLVITMTFLGAGFGAQVYILVTLALITLIAAVVSCCIRFCACCQIPKGVDE